jgi:hypothetical protein
MMKLSLLSILVASAAAFAPAPKTATSTTALNVEIKNQIGAQAPLGFFE